MEAALDLAERLRRAGTDSEAVQSGVSEMLADAQDQLHREARRSHVWSRENLVSFVAGGLGGAGGATVGGTGAAIATGAGSGVIAAFIQAAGQRHSVPRFLDRHYVAFAKPTDDPTIRRI